MRTVEAARKLKLSVSRRYRCVAYRVTMWPGQRFKSLVSIRMTTVKLLATPTPASLWGTIRTPSSAYGEEGAAKLNRKACLTI